MEKILKANFRFMDAIKAGIVATIVFTVILYLLGKNYLGFLGSMIGGPEASMQMIYIYGALFQLAIGVVYSVIYAILFTLVLAPMGLGPLSKAVIFSCILTAAHYYYWPMVPGMLESIFGVNAQDYAMPDNREGVKLAARLTTNWLVHFIFALILALIYRKGHVEEGE